MGQSLAIPRVIPNDWKRLDLIVNKIKFNLGNDSSPTFVGITLTGLTASRLVWNDASKVLASKDLVDLVAGTANEITVADDGSGGVTIGIIDPLIVAKGGIGVATLTDHGILLGSGTSAVTPLGVAANGQIPIGSVGADPVLAEITGTANQITSTPGAGTITLALPQDYHTGASPTLAGLTLSGTLIVEGASVTVGKASTTTGTIVLRDSNSANTITLTVPDISAGSLIFTLPPTDGANTNILQTDGNGILTWVALPSVTPGGADTQIQYNNSGAFGGDTTFIFNNTTKAVSLQTLIASSVCTAAAGLNVLRVTGLQIDGTTMTGTLRGAYVDVSNGSTAATGTIRGMELKARTEAPGDTGNDVNVLEGLSISVDSKGHSVTTMRAAEFILDGAAGGTITEAVGLRIANNLQANKATNSYAIQIYSDSFGYTYGIDLSAGIYNTSEIHFKDGIITSVSGTLTLNTVILDNSGNKCLRMGYQVTDGDAGKENTFFGHQAGQNMDATTVPIPEADGEKNTFVGARAGLGATDGENNQGSENTGIGCETLKYNTIGYENTAVGDEALKRNTTGHGNCAFGNDSLQESTIGNFNTAYGADTLYVNTTGGYNVAIGYQCLFSNTNGAHATAIGYQALYNNTTAEYDIAIGYQAGYNAAGDPAVGKNVIIGYQALYTDNGQYNVAIGYQAGYYNDSIGGAGAAGDQNVYIGYKAGLGKVTHGNEGIYNVAIGTECFVSNEHGINNVAIGQEALKLNTSGNSNFAMGSLALFSNTTGGNNTAIGILALYANIGGASNVALGDNALRYGTAGNYNMAVGSNALSKTTGSNNIGIGRNAGSQGVGNNRNVFIGPGGVCYHNPVDDCVMIGYKAGHAHTLSNRLIIHSTELHTTEAQEITNSLIYGIFDDTVANQSVTFNSDLNIRHHLVGIPDEITATDSGVAASIDTINTEVTTNGDSDLDNVTLANGTSGQIKHIYCVAEGNAADTWKITPATMCGGTQITFAGIGEGCTLVYADDEGWVVVANNGGTIT